MLRFSPCFVFVNAALAVLLLCRVLLCCCCFVLCVGLLCESAFCRIYSPQRWHMLLCVDSNNLTCGFNVWFNKQARNRAQHTACKHQTLHEPSKHPPHHVETNPHTSDDVTFQNEGGVIRAESIRRHAAQIDGGVALVKNEIRHSPPHLCHKRNTTHVTTRATAA